MLHCKIKKVSRQHTVRYRYCWKDCLKGDSSERLNRLNYIIYSSILFKTSIITSRSFRTTADYKSQIITSISTSVSKSSPYSSCLHSACIYTFWNSRKNDRISNETLLNKNESEIRWQCETKFMKTCITCMHRPDFALFVVEIYNLTFGKKVLKCHLEAPKRS